MTHNDLMTVVNCTELEVTSINLLQDSLKHLPVKNWEQQTLVAELRKLLKQYHENLSFMLDEAVLAADAFDELDKTALIYHTKVFSAYNTLVYDTRKIWHQKYADLLNSL